MHCRPAGGEATIDSCMLKDLQALAGAGKPVLGAGGRWGREGWNRARKREDQTQEGAGLALAAHSKPFLGLICLHGAIQTCASHCGCGGLPKGKVTKRFLAIKNPPTRCWRTPARATPSPHEGSGMLKHQNQIIKGNKKMSHTPLRNPEQGSCGTDWYLPKALYMSFGHSPSSLCNM